jgi:hypothetical protein
VENWWIYFSFLFIFWGYFGNPLDRIIFSDFETVRIQVTALFK